MERNNLTDTVIGIAIGVVLIPIMVNGLITCTQLTVCVIKNKIEERKWKKEMKKGLEDGSIIQLGGEYYKVGIAEEA